MSELFCHSALVLPDHSVAKEESFLLTEVLDLTGEDLYALVSDKVGNFDRSLHLVALVFDQKCRHHAIEI